MRTTLKRPLLLLVALLYLPLTARSETPTSDSFAGDERLQGRRTIRAVNTPLRDLLADLNVRTGVRFFADPAVADDRVTLIAHDRPLGETLRALAGFFQFAWKRGGTPGDYGYTLWQTEASRVNEQRAADERAEAAVDLIRREVEAFERLQPLTETEIREKAPEIATQIASEKDPACLKSLRIDYAVLQKLIDKGDWTRIFYKVMGELGRERLLAMMRGGTVEFGWPTLKGHTEFSSELVEEIKRMRPPITNQAYGVGEVYDARLRITPEPGRDPRLRWQMSIGRRQLSTRATFQYVGSAPFSLNPVSDESLPPVEPAGWRSDPSLNIRVDVRLPAPSSGATTAEIQQPAPQKPAINTLGAVLDRLDRAHPIDLIADAFWTTRIAGADVNAAPLGESLTALAKMTSHRWWKQEGFIFVQSRTYAIDRLAEPPASSIARWAQHAADGTLGIDDYAEMAVLPDPRYGTLNQMAINGAFPVPLYPISQGRQHLALWHLLTRGQRRLARTQGVDYKKMTPAQQEVFLRAVTDPSYSIPTAFLTPSLLDTARVRVQTRESRLWGVRTKGKAEGQMSGAPSREEALQYFSQIDPMLRLRDVVSYVTVSVSFLYECDRGYFARGVVTLPPRWEEEKE